MFEGKESDEKSVSLSVAHKLCRWLNYSGQVIMVTDARPVAMTNQLRQRLIAENPIATAWTVSVLHSLCFAKVRVMCR